MNPMLWDRGCRNPIFLCTFLFFWPHPATCTILVPGPGIKPTRPSGSAESQPLDHQRSPKNPILERWVHGGWGLPWWLSSKGSAFNAGDPSLTSGSGEIPWRRKWQPITVFLPGKSHRQEPGGLQSMGLQRVRHDLAIEWQHGGSECGGGGWELSAASFPFSENLSRWLGHCELPPENTSDFKSRLWQISCL